MKKSGSILVLLLIILKIVSGQIPVISNVSFGSSTPKYEKFEINFDLTPYSNPYDYDVIDVQSEFLSPTGKYYIQHAFYYEGYDKTDNGAITTPELLVPNNLNKWKVRFTPNELGQWQFRITAISSSPISQTSYPSSSTFSTFTCVTSNNKGFITKANKRYLKYETGESFYPLGSSYPWFRREPWRGVSEFGTNEVKPVIDEMADNGINFFRFEINLYEGLSLIGYDFTTQKNYLHYYNQHDAKQLDDIMEYAASKNINVLLPLFAHAVLGDDGFFTYNGIPYTNINSQGIEIKGYSNGYWSLYNSFNNNIQMGNEPSSPDSKGNLTNPYQFFSDPDAIDIQKKYVRYVLARWGYSTNLYALELMDETDRLDFMNQNDNNPNYVAPPANLNSTIESWNITMANFIKSNDPHKHLVTTAFSSNITTSPNLNIYSNSNFDFTLIHHYADYGAWSGDLQNSYKIDAEIYTNTFDKPTLLEEYGWVKDLNYSLYDPKMYDLHNNLWGTIFNGSMGAGSIWTYNCISGIPELGMALNTVGVYNGISSFQALLPQLSEQHVTNYVNNQGLRWFYLEDINEDEIYGWVQDMNFIFDNVSDNYNNYLTTLNPFYAPPRGNVYGISMNVSRNGLYNVKWYNTIDGTLYSTDQVASTANSININMPADLRNTIYADAAFIVEYQCAAHWNTSVLNTSSFSPPNDIRQGGSPLVASNDNQIFYIGNDNRIHRMYWNSYYWESSVLNSSAPQNVRSDSDLKIDALNNVYFISDDNRIHRMQCNGSTWTEEALNSSAPQNVGLYSNLAIDPFGNIFFTGNDFRIHIYYWNVNYWQEAVLNSSAPPNVYFNSDLVTNNLGNIFFVGTDGRIHIYYYTGSYWQEAALNPADSPNVRTSHTQYFSWSNSPLTIDALGNIYFVDKDSRIHMYYYNVNYWQHAVLNSSAPQNVASPTGLTCSNNGKIYFVATDNRVHQYYWAGSYWQEAVNNTNDPQNVLASITSNDNTIFYLSSDSKIWSSYWGCNNLFFREYANDETEKDTYLFTNQLEVNIYPNPNNGKFNVEIVNIDDNALIEVYDLMGKLVFEENNVNSKIIIDITDQPQGIYLVKITIGNQMFNKKIIKN